MSRQVDIKTIILRRQLSSLGVNDDVPIIDFDRTQLVFDNGTIEEMISYIHKQHEIYQEVLLCYLEFTKEKRFGAIKTDLEEKKIDLNDFKRVLVLGRTGIGKSTIVNMLINDSADIESMMKPAKISDDVNGVTLRTTNYFSFRNKFILTDTIGFGDVNFSESQILKDIKQLTRALESGFNAIIAVARYGRQSEEDRLLMDILSRLLGDDWQKVSMLVITYGASQTVEDFFRTIEGDTEYKKFCMKFKRVIIVENGIDKNQQIEGIRRLERELTLNDVKEFVSHSTGFIRPIPDDLLTILWDVWAMLKRSFNKIKKRTLLNMTSPKLDNIVGECPVCLDIIHLEESFIPKCYHIIHDRCNRSEICCVCREPVIQF
jgi:GTPase SAR1 family protein